MSEVVDLTGLTQSNASNQLACLLDCDLVQREQRDRSADYSLGNERVDALLSLADEILSDFSEGRLRLPALRPP